MLACYAVKAYIIQMQAIKPQHKKGITMSSKMYVWATGKIEIGEFAPNGAIEIAAAPKAKLEQCLVYAVLSYNRGGHYVGGISEDNTEVENFTALRKYKQTVQRKIDGLHPFTGLPIAKKGDA